jgi:hypothetical protein
MGPKWQQKRGLFWCRKLQIRTPENTSQVVPHTGNKNLDGWGQIGLYFFPSRCGAPRYLFDRLRGFHDCHGCHGFLPYTQER